MSSVVHVNGFVTFKILDNSDVNEVREKIAYSFGYFGDLKKYNESSSPKMSPRGKTGSIGYSLTNDNKYIVIMGDLTDRDHNNIQEIKDWFYGFISDLQDVKEIILGEYTLNINSDGKKEILLKQNELIYNLEQKEKK